MYTEEVIYDIAKDIFGKNIITKYLHNEYRDRERKRNEIVLLKIIDINIITKIFISLIQKEKYIENNNYANVLDLIQFQLKIYDKNFAYKPTEVFSQVYIINNFGKIVKLNNSKDLYKIQRTLRNAFLAFKDIISKFQQIKFKTTEDEIVEPIISDDIEHDPRDLDLKNIKKLTTNIIPYYEYKIIKLTDNLISKNFINIKQIKYINNKIPLIYLGEINDTGLVLGLVLYKYDEKNMLYKFEISIYYPNSLFQTEKFTEIVFSRSYFFILLFFTEEKIIKIVEEARSFIEYYKTIYHNITKKENKQI